MSRVEGQTLQRFPSAEYSSAASEADRFNYERSVKLQNRARIWETFAISGLYISLVGSTALMLATFSSPIILSIGGLALFFAAAIGSARNEKRRMKLSNGGRQPKAA